MKTVTELAQQIADQELEACVQWMDTHSLPSVSYRADDLRNARRPNPPSLKEKALRGLAKMIEHGHIAPDLAKDLQLFIELAPDNIQLHN